MATGVAYFVFANIVPTMSAMRNWLATSAFLTTTYNVVLIVILVKDGTHFFPSLLVDENNVLITKDYLDMNLFISYWHFDVLHAMKGEEIKQKITSYMEVK